MRTGSKREGSEPDEVLGSLVFFFLVGFWLSLAVVFEFEGEVDVTGEGESNEATVEGMIDLSAGLMVEGSNEGSVAICFAIQVLYSPLTLSPSPVLVSGVKVTDFPFEVGVVFNAGGGEVSCSCVSSNLLLTDVSVFTCDSLAFFEGLFTFVSAFEVLLLPLPASAHSSKLDFDFLTFFLGFASSS